MRLIARCLVLCCALSPLMGLAEPVEGLYRVREPLQGPPGEARGEGLKRAFDTLVLRLTGDPQASRSEALAALRDDLQQAVNQSGTEGETLVVDFDPATVQRQLRQAGLALWGADRPAVLSWWLIESAEGTQLVSDGQDSAAPLRAAARHRGLPLLMPLADLAEQLAVTPEALQGEAVDALREVSAPYDADAVLAVHARQGEAGAWQARWQLGLGEARTGGEVAGDSLEAVADAVMLETHGFMAPRFVATPGAAEALVVEVLGADIARFAEVDRLLRPLGAQLQQMDGDRVVYRLEADPEQLRAQLALARLRELPAETPDVAPEPSPEAAEPLDAGAPLQAPVPELQPEPTPEPEGRVLRYGW